MIRDVKTNHRNERIKSNPSHRQVQPMEMHACTLMITVQRSRYSGYRHKKELIFFMTSLLITVPLFLMCTDPRSCSLWGQHEKKKTGIRAHAGRSLFIVILNTYSPVYQRDVDPCKFLHGGGQLCHDIQHFACKFGGSHLWAATGHHGDLLSCRQRLANLLCHLQGGGGTEINVATSVSRQITIL